MGHLADQNRLILKVALPRLARGIDTVEDWLERFETEDARDRFSGMAGIPGMEGLALLASLSQDESSAALSIAPIGTLERVRLGRVLAGLGRPGSGSSPATVLVRAYPSAVARPEVVTDATAQNSRDLASARQRFEEPAILREVSGDAGKQTTASQELGMIPPERHDFDSATSAGLAGRFDPMPGNAHDRTADLARAEGCGAGTTQGSSVPVLRSTPHRAAASAEVASMDVPVRAPTFQDRPDVIGEGVAALAGSRLVTIVGLPGIGKTEVAREVARRSFADSCYARVIYRQVDLGWSVDLLRARLATALGLAEAPDDDLVLARSLGDQPTLLVLDNAEDLMRDDDGQRALRDLVDTLLAHAPALRVLVASRWPISGTTLPEHEVDVPPMARTEMAALLTAELEATGNLDPAWPSSAPWEQLLDLLDGHPRALWLMVRQLAEPRVTIERVIKRLQRARAEAVVDPTLFGRDDVYEALPSDKKARLLSLLASLDLSFSDLGQRHSKAARLFMGLSFFKGGLPEQVAVAVAGTGGETLDHLYRYHLLEWDQGRAYYPAPLRWYAERQRETCGIVDPSPWFGPALPALADFAEACDARVTGGEIVAGVDALLQHEAMIVEVASWAALWGGDEGDRSPVARIAVAAGNSMMFANRLETFGRLLDLGAESAEKAGDTLGAVSCLKSMGDLQMRVADLDGARSSYESALLIFREIRARLGEANCLKSMGDLQMRVDDLEGARSSYESALPIFREVRTRLGEANCLKSLGDLQMRVDDLDGARSSYESALPIYREIRARLGEATCLMGVGDLQMRVDDLDGARSSYESALPICREIRDRLGEANCLKNLGDLQMRVGALDEARSSYESALPIYRVIRARLGEATCLKSLGDLQMRVDDLDGARSSYESALPIYREIKDRLGEANCRQSQGRLAQAVGRPREAFASFLAVLPIFVEIQDQVGQQSAYGYLARVAAGCGETDQALALTEVSLGIGRAIQDRYGQTINLEFQIFLLAQKNDVAAAVAAMLVFHGVAIAMGDDQAAAQYASVLAQAASGMADEDWRQLAGAAENVRAHAVAEAAARLRATGREIYELPADP